MIQRPFQMELALLGYLNENPQHGYSLHQKLSLRTGLGQVWRLKASQLYALLDKLEAAGLISSQVQPQASLPSRRVYSLTEAGAQAFAAWRIEPVERPYQMRQLFFARLFFCLAGKSQDSSDEACLLIARQRECAARWLAELESPPRLAPSPSAFDAALQGFRLDQVRMILNWLDHWRNEFCRNA